MKGNWFNVGFLQLLTLVFIVAKLWEKVDWYWFWVLSPILIPLIIIIIVIVVVFILSGLFMVGALVYDEINERRSMRIYNKYKCILKNIMNNNVFRKLYK